MATVLWNVLNANNIKKKHVKQHTKAVGQPSGRGEDGMCPAAFCGPALGAGRFDRFADCGVRLLGFGYMVFPDFRGLGF